MIQAATEYFFLATSERPIQVRTPTLVQWNAPPKPYVKLNTDGNVIGNPGMAGAEGLLQDSSGFWISGFSLKMGIVTNNMAKLEAVRQGLLLAWQLGFRFIQLELDSTVVLSWLTDKTSSYPPYVMSLIYDCRSLMEQDWEVQAHHIYHEANGCADALAKLGAHQ